MTYVRTVLGFAFSCNVENQLQYEETGLLHYCF